LELAGNLDFIDSVKGRELAAKNGNYRN